MTRAKDSEFPAVVCEKTDKQANLKPPCLEQLLEVCLGVTED